MEIIYAYVDAGYIRNHLRRANMSDEFNPWQVVNSVQYFLPGLAGGMVDRVFFYDALDQLADTEARERQDAYLSWVDRLHFTRVETGYVRRTRKRRREQKAVDVQLAVDALEAALAGRVRGIVLVAGDGDFAPLLDAVRRAGPFVYVLAFPKHLAPELVRAADEVYELPEDFPTEWLFDGQAGTR